MQMLDQINKENSDTWPHIAEGVDVSANGTIVTVRRGNGNKPIIPEAIVDPEKVRPPLQSVVCYWY